MQRAVTEFWICRFRSLQTLLPNMRHCTAGLWRRPGNGMRPRQPAALLLAVAALVLAGAAGRRSCLGGNSGQAAKRSPASTSAGSWQSCRTRQPNVSCWSSASLTGTL